MCVRVMRKWGWVWHATFGMSERAPPPCVCKANGGS